MKKTAFAFLFVLFYCQLFAQNVGVSAYGFKLGLTAHPNFGFGKVEDGKGDGVALGFNYGLIGDFNFAENYSFSTGLTIVSINTKVVELNDPLSATYMSSIYTGPKTPWEIKYKIQYIEVPFTVKLKTANINGVRWFGQFGLSNDIRVGAKLDVEIKSDSFSMYNQNASEDTRTYRAGMIFGGGGEFELSEKTSLLLGLTLNNGFTNISTKKSGSSVKNHYVGLNLGIFF